MRPRWHMTEESASTSTRRLGAEGSIYHGVQCWLQHNVLCKTCLYRAVAPRCAVGYVLRGVLCLGAQLVECAHPEQLKVAIVSALANCHCMALQRLIPAAWWRANAA